MVHTSSLLLVLAVAASAIPPPPPSSILECDTASYGITHQYIDHEKLPTYVMPKEELAATIPIPQKECIMSGVVVSACHAPGPGEKVSIMYTNSNDVKEVQVMRPVCAPLPKSSVFIEVTVYCLRPPLPLD